MIVLIDNYDSFTYNLYHYLMELGADVTVVRNDSVSVSDITRPGLEGIVLSPGPCTPNEAGMCLDLIETYQERYPILGVCLGHQSIGQSFGAEVVRGERPMHAQVSKVHHKGGVLFKDIPSSFKATRYHSLILKKETLPNCLHITAESDDGVIQAVSHEDLPIYGVQFHPESIASEHGHQLIKNFLDICKGGQ